MYPAEKKLKYAGYFAFLVITIVCFSCEREYKNPYDPDVELEQVKDLNARQDGEWIRLTWAEQEDVQSGYQIERRFDNLDFVHIASLTGHSLLSYIDSSITMNTTYVYRIRGYSDKNLTPYSNEAGSHAVFPAAYDLAYAVLSDSSLRLSWQDSAKFSTKFLIEKQSGADSVWSSVDMTDYNVHQFVDEQVPYDQETRYRVTALTDYHQSPSSSVLKTKIVLLPPVLKTVQPLNDHQMQLSWQDNNLFTSGFIIERMSDSEPDWQKVVQTVREVTNFLDDSLKVHIRYTYRLRATSSRYLSDFSNMIQTSTVFPAPQNLKISESSAQSVTLIWDDHPFDEGYILKYVASGEMDTSVNQLAKDINTIELSGLDTIKTYHLILQAFSPFNLSDSKTASINFSKNPVFDNSFPAHQDTVTCLSFAADNQTLASGGKDSDVNFWSVSTGANLKTIDGQSVGEAVRTVVFVGIEAYLAVGFDYSRINLYKGPSWNYYSDINPITYRLHSAANSDAGGWYAVAKYKYIYIWSTASWSIVKSLIASDRNISDLAFDPLGNWLASSSGASDIKIWNTTNWSELQTLDLHSAAVRRLDVSADGQYLASGGDDQQIRIWQTGAWTNIHTIDEHNRAISAVKFSENNAWLASVGKGDNRIYLWNTADWKLSKILSLSTASAITSIAFSADSQYLAGGDSAGRLWIWQIKNSWELKDN